MNPNRRRACVVGTGADRVEYGSGTDACDAFPCAVCATTPAGVHKPHPGIVLPVLFRQQWDVACRIPDRERAAFSASLDSERCQRMSRTGNSCVSRLKTSMNRCLRSEKIRSAQQLRGNCRSDSGGDVHRSAASKRNSTVVQPGIRGRTENRSMPSAAHCACPDVVMAIREISASAECVIPAVIPGSPMDCQCRQTEWIREGHRHQAG